MELFLEKEGKKKGDQVIVVDSKKVLKSQLNDREYKVAVAKLKQNNLVCISTLEENKYAVLLNLKNQEKNRKLGAELVDKITQKAFNGTVDRSSCCLYEKKIEITVTIF